MRIARLAHLVLWLVAAPLLLMSLLWDEPKEDLPEHGVVEPGAGACTLSFEYLPFECAPEVQAPRLLVVTAPRDEDADRRQALVAHALAQLDQIQAEVAAFDQQHGRDLEVELREMLAREFSDIAEWQDPHSADSMADQLVGILLRVADWLEQTGKCTRPARLADLRSAVSSNTLRIVADRLAWWNLQLALAPAPSIWFACGSTRCRSGASLQVMQVIDACAVSVGSEAVEPDDPRVAAARSEHEDVVARRARDLEALLGLSMGALGATERFSALPVHALVEVLDVPPPPPDIPGN